MKTYHFSITETRDGLTREAYSGTICAGYATHRPEQLAATLKRKFSAQRYSVHLWTEDTDKKTWEVAP